MSHIIRWIGYFGAILIFIMIVSEVFADEPVSAGKAHYDHALDVIRNVLMHEQGWPKVHAAEYLIWLHHPEGVQEIFTKELKAHGSEPQYRIGIWRVLGQSAGNDAERKQWFGKIRDVLVSPHPPDRQHAAETLTKLRFRLCADDVKTVKAIADRSQKEPIVSYLTCLLALAEKPGAEAQLVSYLQSPNTQIRLTAAYAMRFLPSVSVGTLKILQKAEKREPHSSPARINVVSALAIHSYPKIDRAWTTELIDCMKHGNDEDKIDAGQALALVGDTSYIPQLKPLLNSSNIDVGSTVAYAILRIGQR